jgi:hypothetical protein
MIILRFSMYLFASPKHIDLELLSKVWITSELVPNWRCRGYLAAKRVKSCRRVGLNPRQGARLYFSFKLGELMVR